jgi:MATE family multidrug resistance protein
MQLFTLFSYFMDGFAYAAEAMTGRYYGAQDDKALSNTIGSLFRWGWLMVALFTLIYWVGGTPFLRLLTTDATVIQAASDYLPWAVLIPLCSMAAFVWDGVFIGTTYTRGMLISCAVAAAVFFSLWFLLSPSMGNHALWVALLSYLALRGIIQTYLWKNVSIFNRF